MVQEFLPRDLSSQEVQSSSRVIDSHKFCSLAKPDSVPLIFGGPVEDTALSGPAAGSGIPMVMLRRSSYALAWFQPFLLGKNIWNKPLHIIL